MSLAAVLEVAPPPAQARDLTYRLDIPAGTLSTGLSALSVATGVSVGLAGELPALKTTRLRGTMTAAEALRRLLSGTGLQAVQIGPLAFRIELARQEPVPHAASAPIWPRPVMTPPAVVPMGDIVVTGQKRAQYLSDVPMSVAILALDGVSPGKALAESRDLALDVEGLAMTNLGPGRNRQFIRGVADSPFNGPSQSTVAVQLDDARVTFDAPDPDLRLVDMERVEILKGPQGPLYGSGALGGIYHMVTRKPALDAVSATMAVFGEAVEHGGLGGGGEAIVNLPLVTDRLGLRFVGYQARGGGWIDNIGRNRDANVSKLLGGRIALRWRPTPDWTVDIGGALQNLNVADSQYVGGSDDSFRRNVRFAEPTDNDFRVVSTTVEGRLGAVKLLSATSYVDHGVDYVLDASAAAAAFGQTGALLFRDDRHYRIFNQEVRLLPAEGGRWVLGAAFMQAESREAASITNATGTEIQVEGLNRHVLEYALFGEAKWPILRHVDLTVGLRLFHTVTEDEALEKTQGQTNRIGKTALSPSVSVSWKPDPDDIVYLRYARALRPGGLSLAGEASQRRFDSDELGTVDLGVRHAPGAGRLAFNASLYYTIWSGIQSDYLLANGLISTRNAGRGRIVGGETSVDWQFARGFYLSAGANVQDARLTATPAGLDIDDRRLPVAPDASARAGIRHEFDLDGWKTALAAQLNYIGRARLAFDADLDREMGNYATVSANASVARGGYVFTARIDNLFDVKGDSFAFGNPFSIVAARQYTPLRPRTFTLSVGHQW